MNLHRGTTKTINSSKDDSAVSKTSQRFSRSMSESHCSKCIYLIFNIVILFSGRSLYFVQFIITYSLFSELDSRDNQINGRQPIQIATVKPSVNTEIKGYTTNPTRKVPNVDGSKKLVQSEREYLCWYFAQQCRMRVIIRTTGERRSLMKNFRSGRFKSPSRKNEHKLRKQITYVNAYISLTL